MGVTFYAGFQNAQGAWDYLESVDTPSFNERNAYDIGAALNVVVANSSMAPMPIARFKARCTAYLRSHLGRPDAEIPMEVIESPGRPLVFNIGRDAGAILNRVMRLSRLADAATAAGATHIYGG